MPEKKNITKKEERPKRKHTRRAALGYLARIGAGAALWGAGGYLAGKVFKYTVKPVVDAVLGASKGVGSAYEGLRKLNPFYKPKPVTVTRRGFLSSLVKTAYRHPVAAGTITGTTYGAGKYALSGMSKYLTARQMAILKDENADYKERLNVLENYKEKLEKGMEERDANIAELKKELTNVRGIIRQLEKPGKLEEVALEGEVQGPTKEMLLVLGISGLLISLGLSSMTITGNTIFNTNTRQMISMNIAIFVISLILILFAIKRRR